MKLSDIKLKDRNPRTITPEALSKLAESIKRDPEFMVLRPMVIDNDNIIIGGNQRYKAIELLDMQEVPDNWVVKAGSLTQEQLKRFVVIDNAPSGMAGDWDLDMLKEDWELPELTDLGFNEYQFDDLSIAGLDTEQDIKEDNQYTKTIVAPIYKPVNEKPEFKDLFDTKKSNMLIDEINKSDISIKDKEFLIEAAKRHTVFNYQRIADYYAHSNKATQELMEKSALIIIDFNKAIENGYVKLSEDIVSQYSEDYSIGDNDVD